MEFKVKRDIWQIVVKNLLFILLFGAFLPLAKNYTATFLILDGIIAVFYGFYIAKFSYSNCILKDHTLVYSAGPYKYIIFLQDIISVEKSINIYNSLALSIERIRIVCKTKKGQKVYYISVHDEDTLIEIIKSYMKDNSSVGKFANTVMEENEPTIERLRRSNVKVEKEVVVAPKKARTSKTKTANLTAKKSQNKTSAKQKTSKNLVVSKVEVEAKPKAKSATKKPTTRKTSSPKTEVVEGKTKSKKASKTTKTASKATTKKTSAPAKKAVAKGTKKSTSK